MASKRMIFGFARGYFCEEMQTLSPDTAYGMLRAARVLSAPTKLHVHKLKLVLRQWTTAQKR